MTVDTFRHALGLALCAAFAALAAPAFGQIPTKSPAKPAAQAEEPLGRLFFTPAQRASLDIARKQRARTAVASDNTAEETAAPVPQTITYDGVVRRSDGKSTVWLNSRPVHDREPVGGVAIVGRVRPDGGVTLQAPQTGRSVDLKPGQSIELLSGTIEESFSRKPVAVKPEPKPDAKAAAKPATEGKPAAKPDAAAAERDREEREQQRVQEAVSQALKDRDAKPAASAGASEGPAK
jgi:hypothetical protein